MTSLRTIWPRYCLTSPGTDGSTWSAVAAAQPHPHIAAIARAVSTLPTRKIPSKSSILRLSGLEPLLIA